jgi:hypothetical protein
MMPKVYDCFTFNGEWDMLELRLHTHDSAVDYYVIAESNWTHAGNLKPHTSFNICDPRLVQFAHKIRYVLVTDMPNTGNAWDNEHWQRNALMRGLWDAQDDDLILISDCDEIVKPWFIQSALHETNQLVFGFQQPVYYCYMNNKQMDDTFWSVAVRYKKLHEHDPNWYRLSLRLNYIQEPYYWYANAGWHYSYMMDKEHIIKKLEEFSHTELNTDQVKQQLDPESAARQGRDILGRDYVHFQLIPQQEVDLPSYVINNKEKFARFFLD